MPRKLKKSKDRYLLISEGPLTKIIHFEAPWMFAQHKSEFEDSIPLRFGELSELTGEYPDRVWQKTNLAGIYIFDISSESSRELERKIQEKKKEASGSDKQISTNALPHLLGALSMWFPYGIRNRECWG